MTEEITVAPKFGLLALVEAKPGKEQEVWDFLNGGRDIVLSEPGHAYLVCLPCQ